MLLHGGQYAVGQHGNFKNWTENGGDAIDVTAGEDVIVVMPDGGNGGFFTNWGYPWAATVNWEDFHLDQLMNWMDDNFHTFVGWRTKAIAGWLMGTNSGPFSAAPGSRGEYGTEGRIADEYHPMHGRTHDCSNWNENLARDLPGILDGLPH